MSMNSPVSWGRNSESIYQVLPCLSRKVKTGEKDLLLSDSFLN
jgi:hypothetical protein